MFSLDKFYLEAFSGDKIDIKEIIDYIKSFSKVILWGASYQGKAIGKKLISEGVNISNYWDIRYKEIKDVNEKIKESQKVNNIGGFSRSSIERFITDLGTDISSLYDSFLRAVARGVFPEEYLTNLFDFKKIFMECYNSLHIMDIFLDKKIHYMRYTASKHGKEFLKWFDENIYNVIMNPILIDENKVEEQFKRKKYKEGKNEFGGITLDASKYGVTNVYEAVKLFKKLTKF